ncbi:LysR family transcriptional regulator, partial [Klebsiella variicola]
MANLYDLKKFDLNLLVIFECIYQHLSISKAAAMLFITPSAVSQSLQRLRQQLNDPLFVRVGKGMTPTTACVNLHYHLQQNLEQLEKTINLNNRSELRKRIVIYGPPLFCSVNSHFMINELCHQANLQIEHHNLTTTESAEELLAYRQADLVFTRMPITNRATICQPYQTVQTLAVCRADHPRRDQLTSIEALAQEFFTHYITNDPVIQRVQQSSTPWLNPGNIAFRSDSFMTILNMINKTDLIG